MINLEEFIKQPKALLIAPAGFGKSHTICQCVDMIPTTSKKILILTHTHAGVASIKDKFKKNNIGNNYEVETISSFIQRYVHAYKNNAEIPDMTDTKRYYSFLIDYALILFKTNIIKEVIRSSYGHLFVDEYQDCTVRQHNFIRILSEVLPTKLLGDYLQGIFEFNEATVDLQSNIQMQGFIENSFELYTPQRWVNNNSNLGNDLKIIREKIDKQESITFSHYSSIKFYAYPYKDIYIHNSDYQNLIRNLIDKNESLLLLTSNTFNINKRLEIMQKFNCRVRLLEAIDEKLFYEISEMLEIITIENIEIQLKEICSNLFNKTAVNQWFNDKGFKKKTKEADKERITNVKTLITSYKLNLDKIITAISEFPDFKCYRKEVLKSLIKCINIAKQENISYKEAMIKQRNTIRRLGRRIEGRCIGTTLLTKGLEFDTVVILDAHNFKCCKHFYVAITRACKQLVIISEKSTITFS